jgi:hypothetical protein
VLVSEVIDRTYSEWLAPAGVDRPASDLLATDWTASTPGTGDTFSVEGRLNAIPPDSLLEIGRELVLTRDFSTNDTGIVQDRGYLDTDPDVHLAGSKVYVNPKYSRQALLHACASVIGELYSLGLYVKAIDETQVYNTRETRQLPPGGKAILSILVRTGGGLERYEVLDRKGRDWIEYHQFTPSRYYLMRGGTNGLPMVISYKKDFILPTAESDELTDLGVMETLQPYLPLAMAGYVLQSKEIPRVQVEEIRRMLATTGIQVGQVMNIGQQMLRTFQQQYVGAERRRLREEDPYRVAWLPA